jgi:aldehyde dehydrogenase (NAD+)
MRGFYLEPVQFTNATNQMRISREDKFGPLASIIRAKEYDAELEPAKGTPYCLPSGICTTSLKYAAHFNRNAEDGIVTANAPTAGVYFSSDGRRASPHGLREQGRYAAEPAVTVVKIH